LQLLSQTSGTSDRLCIEPAKSLNQLSIDILRQDRVIVRTSVYAMDWCRLTPCLSAVLLIRIRADQKLTQEFNNDQAGCRYQLTAHGCIVISITTIA
jgi:hypothetical protein